MSHLFSQHLLHIGKKCLITISKFYWWCYKVVFHQGMISSPKLVIIYLLIGLQTWLLAFPRCYLFFTIDNQYDFFLYLHINHYECKNLMAAFKILFSLIWLTDHNILAVNLFVKLKIKQLSSNVPMCIMAHHGFVSHSFFLHTNPWHSNTSSPCFIIKQIPGLCVGIG